jgi:hypothetical protein
MSDEIPSLREKESNLGHVVMSCTVPEICFHVGDELGTVIHFVCVRIDSLICIYFQLLITASCFHNLR